MKLEEKNPVDNRFSQTYERLRFSEKALTSESHRAREVHKVRVVPNSASVLRGASEGYDVLDHGHPETDALRDAADYDLHHLLVYYHVRPALFLCTRRRFKVTWIGGVKIITSLAC